MNEFMQGLQMLMDPQIILYIFIGLLVGLFIGAVPGLNDTNILTLFLTIVPFMEPFPAVMLMTSLFVASQTGGSIPAILVNIPGTPSTAASTFEGFPLTRKGLGAQALGCSFGSSLLGTCGGGILALIFAPIIGRYALVFGPPEMFMLALFGMTCVAALAGKSVKRGLLSAVLGLLVGTIGVDYFIGISRSTFGIINLYSGVPDIPLLLGLFGVGELYNMVMRNAVVDNKSAREEAAKRTSISGQLEGFRAAFKNVGTMVMSTVIGFVIGVIPGTGATIASYTCYGMARTKSKEPEKFGTGHYDGLVATDTANNSCVPGSIVTALTLGIPGSGTTVLFLSALLMHNFVPGPTFFSQHLVEANCIFIIVVIIGIFASLFGIFAAKYLVKVVTLPTYILGTAIAEFCLTGSFICANKITDIYIMVFFSLISIFMRKFGYSMPAFLLGIILGPIIEPNFWRALAITNNNYSIFFTRPICIFLWILIVVTLLVPRFMEARQKKIAKNSQQAKEAEILADAEEN